MEVRSRTTTGQKVLKQPLQQRNGAPVVAFARPPVVVSRRIRMLNVTCTSRSQTRYRCARNALKRPRIKRNQRRTQRYFKYVLSNEVLSCLSFLCCTRVSMTRLAFYATSRNRLSLTTRFYKIAFVLPVLSALSDYSWAEGTTDAWNASANACQCR